MNFKAANCSIAFSLAVLSGVTNENEIENLANKKRSNELNEEQTKLLPDYYCDKLGVFHVLIEDD